MNIAKMMKQAQQMQSDFKRIQSELTQRTFQGSAGGGAVQATTSGDGELKEIKISPDLLKDGDVEILQDMIISAVQEASSNAKAELQKEMNKLTGGLGLPPGLGF